MMPRSRLGWLDFLVPKDAGTRRVAADVAFGPLPRQRLDLYAPVRRSAPLPLMLFFYGGGWNSGTRTEYSFAGHAFAGLGFLTVVADYRIVPDIVFPAFVEDCALAARWAVENAAAHGGDPGRVWLSGHSAGAYNAVMLGLDPARFGCPGLEQALRGIVGLSGPYDFYPFNVRESRDAFGSAAEPHLTQPINLVQPGAPPMFLAHGQRDRLVHPNNTRALAAALQQAGVPVTERYYPRYGHADTLLNLLRPLRWRDHMFAHLADFLHHSG
jgi:acetyl esterase/lipase